MGIALRHWFSQLVVGNLIYDQWEYLQMAEAINTNTWSVNCCARTYGYPLFLAIIFRITGGQTYEVVKHIQLFLDIATGGFLALSAYHLTKTRLFSILVYAFYLFNPFTTAYPSFILTETLTFFMISISTYIADTRCLSASDFSGGVLVVLFLYHLSSMDLRND
jgi:hypothetical protein